LVFLERFEANTRATILDLTMTNGAANGYLGLLSIDSGITH